MKSKVMYSILMKPVGRLKKKKNEEEGMEML